MRVLPWVLILGVNDSVVKELQVLDGALILGCVRDVDGVVTRSVIDGDRAGRIAVVSQERGSIQVVLAPMAVCGLLAASGVRADVGVRHVTEEGVVGRAQRCVLVAERGA